MAADSALSQELELLRASYGNELVIHQTQPASVTLEAIPHTHDALAPVFASVTIGVAFPVTYPRTPATYTFADERGLDDKQLRSLGTKLKAEAKEAASHAEVHVASGLVAVAEFLTSCNQPNQCPVCFECIATDAKGAEKMVVLEPCLHALHGVCFAGYKQTLEERRREKEYLLLATEGRTRAARLARLKWATCPICRLEFDCPLAEAQAWDAGKD